MTEKLCNKCLIVKSVSEFGKEARALNGYKPRCKKCTNEYYNSKYQDFKEAKLKQLKDYYKVNSDVKKEYGKKYYHKNKEVRQRYNREWNAKNRVKISEKKLLYINSKRKTDPVFRLQQIMRKVLWRSITEKRGGTFKLLGYNLSQLILTLGRTPELNESIDHKIPITWFAPETPPNIVHHLDNLQILPKSENFKKNCFYAHPIPSRYFKIIKPFINKDKLKNIPLWKQQKN